MIRGGNPRMTVSPAYTYTYCQQLVITGAWQGSPGRYNKIKNRTGSRSYKKKQVRKPSPSRKYQYEMNDFLIYCFSCKEGV